MPVTVLPVIHYESDEQALENAAIAFDAGCPGIFLIHMEVVNHLLVPIAQKIKQRYPDKKIGINFLGVPAADAVTANIAAGIDMTWTDVQLTHTAMPLSKAEDAKKALEKNPGHMLFSGVAFKHQKNEPHPGRSAQLAIEYGFIPTTSGSATGVAAEQGKIKAIRDALGASSPLAIASGITPENAHEFAPFLTHILVATGVSKSFYEFDFEKLYQLRVACDKA